MMIIIGGIMYATSAGDTGKVTRAKNTVTYAVTESVNLMRSKVAEVQVADRVKQLDELFGLARRSVSLAAGSALKPDAAIFPES